MERFEDVEIDEPVTDADIDTWWGYTSSHLIGFVVAGHEGASGTTHWLAVARNQAEHVELYRLCDTMNDDLPWAPMPGALVTCMTCLVYASRPNWKAPF